MDEQNNSPVLNSSGIKGWKTSMPLSVCGVIAGYAYWNIVNLIDSAAVYLPLTVIYIAACIYWPAMKYPSFFRSGIGSHSCGAISFWNCALGGIIFGPLWNHNLTRGEKGVSATIFVALMILATALIALGLFFALTAR